VTAPVAAAWQSAAAWLSNVVVPRRDGSGSPLSPITRDGAQADARHELAKHAYHQGKSLTRQVADWVFDKLSNLLDSAARHAPGKGIGLLVIVAVVVLLIAVVATRLGAMQRLAKAEEPILGSDIVSPADHRQRAREFADAAQWAEAVREWLRAITRELEERGTLDPRPGRTAAELCREASSRLPAIAQDLRRSTSTFDAVWYGGRSATADDEQLLRRLDREVAGSHKTLAHKTAAHNTLTTAGGT
jgi:hypothetical protein